jgi:hypothetical protein
MMGASYGHFEGYDWALELYSQGGECSCAWKSRLGTGCLVQNEVNLNCLNAPVWRHQPEPFLTTL